MLQQIPDRGEKVTAQESYIFENQNKVNHMDVYHITEIWYGSRKPIDRLKVMTSFTNYH